MARNVRAAFDPKAFFSTVAHGRTLSSVARNAVIFRQSRPADAVFYIQKGRIKIVVTSKQGKEAVVGVLGAGDFFGEAA
jgi:CRP/FNR family cyclic AMP-dependent transcriptional regulator